MVIVWRPLLLIPTIVSVYTTVAPSSTSKVQSKTPLGTKNSKFIGVPLLLSKYCKGAVKFTPEPDDWNKLRLLFPCLWTLLYSQQLFWLSGKSNSMKKE